MPAERRPTSRVRRSDRASPGVFTAGELIDHVRTLEAKARAYDALVADLTEQADHLDARGISYHRSGRDFEAKGDDHRREWCVGKAQAYCVSADTIRTALKGSQA